MEWKLLYLSVRTVVWLLVASFLAIKMGSVTQVHRTHLTYMIAGITGMFALRDLWELVTVAGPYLVNYVTILLSQLSEASFMGLLLFVSGGYGITIGRVMELPQYCFVLPSIFLVASVTFKFLLEYTRNADSSQISDWEVYIALVSGLVQAVIAVMSWMSVLESSEKVAKQLEQMAPRAARDVEAAPPQNTFQLSPDEEDHDGFQVVHPEVLTVAEEVDRMKKADLMRKFKIAVTLYMFAFVAAFFIPVYDDNAALIIIMLWNSILLALLLVLAWVFRPREEENPYLFVGEDEAQNVHLDTAMNIEMSRGMPAIQEMPDEDAPSSAQNSPARVGSSPMKGTVVVPQISGGTNGDATNGSKREESVAAADGKANKVSHANGEDPKLE